MTSRDAYQPSPTPITPAPDFMGQLASFVELVEPHHDTVADIAKGFRHIKELSRNEAGYSLDELPTRVSAALEVRPDFVQFCKERFEMARDSTIHFPNIVRLIESSSRKQETLKELLETTKQSLIGIAEIQDERSRRTAVLEATQPFRNKPHLTQSCRAAFPTLVREISNTASELADRAAYKLIPGEPIARVTLLVPSLL